MKQSWAMLTSSLCALSLCSSLQVYADTTTTTGADCGPGPKHMRVDLRYTSPKGIGYTTGYTTAEGFFSPTQLLADAWLPFLDVRGHVFDNGKFAANIGVGLRRLGTSRVNGFNLFYDYRNTNRQHYNQTSLGLESLGRIWDFRINGYLPVGKKQSGFYHTEFDKFEGNSLFIKQTRNFALAGFNAEGGFHLDHFKKAPLYFAAGPYYLTGSGSSTWGGQIRGRVDLFSRYLRLEANAGYDHFFKWTGQGIASVNIPLGRKSKIVHKGSNSCSKDTALSYRMIQPVDRNEIIPVGKQKVVSEPINPLTGQPYTFLFVSNLSHSAGTYESPYNTLADAETASGPGDIIYIFPGDGTSTGMASGITLQDNQKLWGSVVTQNLLTTAGNVSIPAQSSGIVQGIVISPVITNTSNTTVVSVMSGNEISGLVIQNVGGSSYGIANPAAATDLTVLNCTIVGSSTPYIGISLTDLGGTLTVDNCTINQDDYGIFIGNNSNLIANISNSNFNAGTAGSIYWQYAGPAAGTLALENCVINSTGDAVIITQVVGSSMFATLNNNQINASGTSSVGVNMLGTGTSEQILSMTGNTILSNNQAVYITQTDTVLATLTNNNLMSVNDFYAFELDSNSGSTSATLTFTGNTIVGAYDAGGLYFNQLAGAVNASFQGNSIAAFYEGYGLNISMGPSASSFDLTFNDNMVDSSYYPAINLVQNGGALDFVLNNNTIKGGAYDNATVYCQFNSGSIKSDVTMNGNTLTGYYSAYIDQSGTGASNVSFTNNTSTQSYYGFYGSINSGTNTITMTGNTIAGTSPITISQGGTGSLGITVEDNTITSNGGYGYWYNGGGTATSTQTISNNTISSSGSTYSAINLSNAVASFTGTISGNTLSSSTYAVTSALTTGTQELNLSDNIVTNSGGFNLSTEGTARWQVEGNALTAISGIAVNATSGSGTVSCMQLNNNAVYPTSSANAYVLNNAGSGFTLNPPSGNTGNTNISLTSVTTAPCQ